ncbi:baseplate J/gp47 family protein [bacterium 210820-DFI.6.37]|nr:baseplate J/gp47 family protein [bacterium 210820-DFI.6.37]
MAFNFLETDAQIVSETVLTALTEEVGEPLYPGDERRIFGEAVAMTVMQVYNYLDDRAKQRLLKYARGEVLDALAEDANVERIAPTPATDTVRFTLSTIRQRNTVIPEGTKVTHDGLIFFTTDRTAIIQAGEMNADVGITCSVAGEDYNGIEAGKITTIVDPQPYVMEVINLYGTNGGDNGEEYTEEGDEKLRERVRLANAAASTAGPEDAYAYHTLSLDASIMDVYVDSPEPCEIVIYPLLEGGELPDEDLLNKIADLFHNEAKKTRPMTDHVTARAPTEITYDIELKYYCTIENEKAAVNLVEMEGGLIDSYIEWQSGKLGRSVNPDGLRRELMQNTDELGVLVERVEIISPPYMELKKTEIAKFSGKMAVTHGVIEE